MTRTILFPQRHGTGAWNVLPLAPGIRERPEKCFRVGNAVIISAFLCGEISISQEPWQGRDLFLWDSGGRFWKAGF